MAKEPERQAGVYHSGGPLTLRDILIIVGVPSLPFIAAFLMGWPI